MGSRSCQARDDLPVPDSPEIKLALPPTGSPPDNPSTKESHSLFKSRRCRSRPYNPLGEGRPDRRELSNRVFAREDERSNRKVVGSLMITSKSPIRSGICSYTSVPVRLSFVWSSKQDTIVAMHEGRPNSVNSKYLHFMVESFAWSRAGVCRLDVRLFGGLPSQFRLSAEANASLLRLVLEFLDKLLAPVPLFSIKVWPMPGCMPANIS
mmetsp:Transcript_13968/g.40892  ORF Transcript_13968/g.40892 Transcript_13968/m.40892 type:complete len:209 (-) Transcript_13968:928-1554(-)